MNNNLRSIHLGAPQSIEGGDAPNLETLDIQITELLESITLHGNTGTKSPFERAADLLHQQEVEMSYAEGIRPYADENHEYWELDCIISDGVSWIDTGIIPINQQMKTEVLIPQVASGIIVGTNEARTSTVYGLCVSAYSFYGMVHGDHRHITVPLNTRVQVIIDKQFAVGDTTDPSPFIESGVLPTTNLLLFNGNTTINSSTNAKVPNWKMYSFSLKDLGTNELVRDLVPAMHIKTREVGMYDKVTKQFLHAQGGGQFGYEFKYDDSVSLNIPDDAILNGGSTTCEIKTDGTTLPPTDFYWQLTNINPESTGHPTIDQQGNITIEPDTWAEFDVNIKRYADASWKSLKTNLNFIQQYPWFDDIPNYVRENIVRYYQDFIMLDNLQSAGTNKYSAVINTGIPAKDVETYIKYIKQGNAPLFGTNTSEHLYTFAFNSLSTFYIDNVQTLYNAISNADGQHELHILKDRADFTINGISGTKSHSLGLPTSEETIWLFQGLGKRGSGDLKIQLTKLSKQGSIVWHGVPSKRRSDGELGFYDFVNGVFHTNAGTGTFIAGDVIELGSEECINKLI